MQWEKPTLLNVRLSKHGENAEVLGFNGEGNVFSEVRDIWFGYDGKTGG